MGKKRARRLTPGEEAIAWIEQHCRVPEGAHVGRMVVLRPWQRDVIRGIYDSPTRRAIVSFGRKNSKTTMAAFQLLLHLCGPQARQNSQLYSAAQSRDQASILFALAAKMVRMSPDLAAFVVVCDTAKQLACPELGTLGPFRDARDPANVGGRLPRRHGPQDEGARTRRCHMQRP